MAGVLFVVCIPREKYEKCISNKQQSSEEDGFGEANVEMNESFSSISVQVKYPGKSLNLNINNKSYFCLLQDSSLNSNSSIVKADIDYAVESKNGNSSKKVTDLLFSI